MIKNYGFKLNEVEDLKAYRLGAIELPKIVLVKDGQWGKYLPSEELQHTPTFDTFGCVVFATENIQQILEIFHNGYTREYAERYNYNLCKIVPPGADPHDVAESFRNDGVLPYEDLLMTSTLEEYAKPRPVPNSLISKGIAHLWELRHQWLWQKPISKEERTKLIKEYLQYSPLCVSVTAWSFKNEVYVDEGKSNTHLTVLYGYTDKGWLIFDSYSPHRKVLSFDHNIECAKRYQLVANTRKEQLSILGKILSLIGKWLNLIDIPTTEPLPKAPPVAPQPQPEPVKISKLIDWAKSIETYEGAKKSWHNPGAIRSKNGKFLIFKTYEAGWNYLLDYLTRAATGRHKAYRPEFTLHQFFNVYAPASDNNNPNAYASFVAKRIGVTIDEKIKNLV